MDKTDFLGLDPKTILWVESRRASPGFRCLIVQFITADRSVSRQWACWNTFPPIDGPISVSHCSPKIRARPGEVNKLQTILQVCLPLFCSPRAATPTAHARRKRDRAETRTGGLLARRETSGRHLVGGEMYIYGVQPGESQVDMSPLCRPSLSASCRSSDDPWVHDSGET